MDPITLKALQGAAGAAGDDKVYVEEVFSTYLYDGNSGSQSINNGIDLDGEGGMVWIKERDGTDSHALFDTERGVQKYLKADTGDNAYTRDPGDALSAFNSDGFSFNGAFGAVNNSSKTYTSWSFRKAPGFFDVVTYEGDDVAGREIAHSLGSVPGMIIIKETDGTEDWRVYHRSLGGTKNLRLNQNYIAGTNTPIFNDTDPTSSVFTVGTDPATNGDGKNFVAYLFAHDDQSFGEDGDESIIKCGSYTGTSTAGNTVDLGFEPQFVLLKSAVGGTGDWRIIDNMRGFVTGTDGDATLNANTDEVEFEDYTFAAATSTGFTLEATSSPSNTSGRTYIYMAIRRPHKKPAAGTEVFYSLSRAGNDTDTPITGVGFSPDAHFSKLRPLNGSSYMNMWFDKLRGAGTYLRPTEDAAEATSSNILLSFDQDGVTYGEGNNLNGASESSGGDYINWMFKRAPGFFDVVAFEGDGSWSARNHNLGVTPELVIQKTREYAEDWNVITTGKIQYLNKDQVSSNSTVSNSHSSTVFGVNTDSSSDSYIAYLFATLPGISKVGTYSGTGNDIDVDCGFTSGARFVMVKRTDDDGDWYVWDTERGITAGDDPYLFMNEYTAEVTNNSNIDPHNPGFQITDDAPDALNVSGGTYIYLAIA
jgi:hypothetical protein